MDLERAASLLKAAIKRLFGFYVIRPAQRFNVENRSEKVLEKEKVKPRAAPKHPGTQDLYKRIVSGMSFQFVLVNIIICAFRTSGNQKRN